jgi:hypothetical protein
LFLRLIVNEVSAVAVLMLRLNVPGMMDTREKSDVLPARRANYPLNLAASGLSARSRLGVR